MTTLKPAKRQPVVARRAVRQASGPAETSRLTRDHWLDAAFDAVVEGGFDAVRVLVIADKLGVTRGSFYWHFADHADLIKALWMRWRDAQNTLNAKTRSELLDDPREDLENVLDIALAQAGADLRNMRFELALRGLGRRDAAVADMLNEVDRLRHQLFEDKFLRLTGDAAVAADLGSLFYLCIVGSHQALSRPGVPPRLKDYFKSTISRYLIANQSTAPAKQAAAPRQRRGTTSSRH